MKIYKPIGSKERFLEMFQGVNKMNLNENALNAVNPVEAAFDDLVNKNLNIEQVNNQVNGGESIIEIVGIDRNGVNVVFKFTVQSQGTDQEGVNQIQDVKMISAKVDDNMYDDAVLGTINASREQDMIDAVSEYVEFKSDVDTVSDEMYEEAVKFIDKVPYKKGTENIQTSKAYGDEKPTNPDVRVKAPELDQFVSEIQDYVSDEIPEQDPMAIPDIDDMAMDDDGTTGVDPYDQQPDFSGEPEVSPEKAAVINQAYDNLMNAGNLSPTQDDIMREITNLQGNIQSVEKTRAIPRGAEAFWESTDQDRYEDVVFMQGEEADEALEILKNQGRDAALQHLMQWHQPGNHMGSQELGHGTNDQTYEKDGYTMAWNFPLNYIGLQYCLSGLDEAEEDYPKQLGKKFKPKRQIPKKKKKPQTVVKLSEEEANENFHAPRMTSYSAGGHEHLLTNNPEEIEKIKIALQPGGELEKLNKLFDISDDKIMYSTFGGRAAREKMEQVLGRSLNNLSSQMSSLTNEEDQEVGNELEGGLGDDKELSQFCPIQVAKGVKIEMEHTNNPLIAVEIVMDHLTEDPHYYGKGTEDPEEIAQQNAEINVEKQEDDEVRDELLGFKPLNVGDDVDENEFVDREKTYNDINSENIEIKINGYPWYGKKIDSTHLLLSNTFENIEKSIPWNIDQFRGKSYYDDLKSWLHNEGNPSGNEYEDIMETVIKDDKSVNHINKEKHSLAGILDGAEDAEIPEPAKIRGVNRALEGQNLAEDNGFTEYMGDVGDRYKDANDNEFTVRNKVKGGVTLQGQAGEKEVATSDLLFLKKS